MTTPSRTTSGRCSRFRRGSSAAGRPVSVARWSAHRRCPARRLPRCEQLDEGQLMPVHNLPNVQLLVVAALLLVLGGLFAMTDAALYSVSVARSGELAREGVRG